MTGLPKETKQSTGKYLNIITKTVLNEGSFKFVYIDGHEASQLLIRPHIFWKLSKSESTVI